MSRFVKLSASGNDFVLVDGRQGLPCPASELAERVCPRQTSIGADGLLVVRDDNEVSHYEPDGSETFCLNGLRAAAAWIVASGQSEHGRELIMRSADQEAEVHVDCSSLEFEVSVALPRPLDVAIQSVSLPQGVLVHGVFVDVGNPQFVVMLETGEQLDDPHLMQRARALRWSTAFHEGSNVAFVAPCGGDEYRIRSYERGVEGETLSCGTGIVAAACALVEAPSLVLANTPGGPDVTDPLTLRFHTESGEVQRVCFPDGKGSPRVWSTGPVRILYTGSLWTSQWNDLAA